MNPTPRPEFAQDDGLPVPKGVVWDVGNVIVRWDPRTLYSKIFPDPAIFHLLCERVGMGPEELLFVDNSAGNVEAAREIGFYVHRFREPRALRSAVEARGMLARTCGNSSRTGI